MLYDVASLLADLHHRGAALLANIVFNRYLDDVADAGNLPVLPLMLSIRAATRAYGLAGSAQRRADPSEFAALTASAKSMFDLAHVLLRPHAPRAVAFGGFGGSRKTELVEQIASDVKPVPGARIPAKRPRAACCRPYRARSTALGGCLSAGNRGPRLRNDQGRSGNDLRAGHSVVVDASFFYPHHRRDFRAMAEAARHSVLGNLARRETGYAARQRCG